MKPEEVNYQNLVNQFFKLISNEDLTDILIESFTNSIKQNLIEEIETKPEAIASKIFVQHEVIKFFNQINNLRKSDI
jgi:hypothetical protein